MSTPISVARCWALTTMPFSAATGRSEAAWADGTRPATRKRAAVRVPNMMPDRAPTKPRKDMTNLLSFHRAVGHKNGFNCADLWVLFGYPAVRVDCRFRGL